MPPHVRNAPHGLTDYADPRQKYTARSECTAPSQNAPQGPRPPAGAKRSAYFSPGSTGGSPDSTRFFKPANARSMMTFSALRLIMPSIGILTSTVRR